MKKNLLFKKALLLNTLLLILPFLINTLWAQGNILYTLTASGGANSTGAIISFNPTTGAENVVYSFGQDSDGRNADKSGLVYHAGNGLFYAVTNGGGVNNKGAIISFNPATNSESVVWSFGKDTDGTYPRGNLCFNPVNGLFYGATAGGGNNNGSNGTIFSFNPVTNAEHVVWSLGKDSDGANPESSLVYDTANGLFYGTTIFGGSHSNGAIISFDPATNTERLLWSFGANVHTDAKMPQGDLAYNPGNGLYYGVTRLGGNVVNWRQTYDGGGTIYSFNPSSGNVSVVYNFGNDNDVYGPINGLTYDPVNSLFYTITLYGGTQDTLAGGIISFNPNNNTEAVVGGLGGHPNDGFSPSGTLFYNVGNGLLYGVTFEGGLDSVGAIVSFDPTTNTESPVWSFVPGTDGTQPSSSFVSYSGPTGISPVNKTSVIIYPDPATDIININGLAVGQTVVMCNLLGQQVCKVNATGNEQKLIVSSYAPGIYLLQVFNVDGTVTYSQQIVKED